VNTPSKTPSETDTPSLLGVLSELVTAVKAIANTLATPSIDPELRCFTAEQAADAFGVSKWWVMERMDDEAIPFTRIGKHRRMTAKHIRAVIEADEIDPTQRGRKSLPRVPAQTRGSRAA
jgi:hypothetical protein